MVTRCWSRPGEGLAQMDLEAPWISLLAMDKAARSECILQNNIGIPLSNVDRTQYGLCMTFAISSRCTGVCACTSVYVLYSVYLICVCARHSSLGGMCRSLGVLPITRPAEHSIAWHRGIMPQVCVANPLTCDINIIIIRQCNLEGACIACFICSDESRVVLSVRFPWIYVRDPNLCLFCT